jgi:catechol 2,3-dioxygenase-like lactoylglutathione lyase family enzyme
VAVVDRVEQRLSFVTLAVRDLDASRRFYRDGLGWEPTLDVPGEVLMVKVGAHVVLSLWDRGAFEREVGPVADGPGLAPVTLSHNVATPDAVDAVLAVARAAGAEPVSPAEDRDWGGRSGYFGDPDGFRWEVAWNPGPIGQEVLP